MKIIRATMNEIPDIVFLNSYVQKIHHEKFPDIFKPTGNNKDVHKFFELIISKENNYLFMAYQEGVAAGYCWAAIEARSDSALKYSRKQVYVHQIAVHEKYRNQRIGRALFAEIEKVARQEGIEHFEVDSWFFNSGAQTFFNKLGFETYKICLWRK
jgi:ribosomal protein S18 acetylase RimI-like enzyme